MTSRTFQMIAALMLSVSTIAAMDIFLPSLPSMAVHFGVSGDEMQLSVPVYMIGSVLAAPVLGLLSDVLGRRSVMMWSTVLFLTATVWCVFAPTLEFFLIGRFFQGVGAVSSSAVGWALIQDLYPKDESARIMAWMGTFISTVPLIAPALGGYMHTVFGWQANFVLIFVLATITFALIYFSKPTLIKPPNRPTLSLWESVKTYGQIVSDGPFLMYISFFALYMCGEWVYLTVVPFYFENQLGLMPDVFGIYISVNAAFYIAGTALTPLILRKFGVKGAFEKAFYASLVGVSFFIFISLFFPTMPTLIVLGVGIYFLGAAIVWGPSTTRALQQFEDKRGAASAVRSILTMGACAFGGFVGSYMSDNSLFPIGLILLVVVLLCLFIFQRAGKLISH